MGFNVLNLAQTGQTRGRKGRKVSDQPVREYRTFDSKDAITAAVESALDDAKVDDPTLIKAYHNVVASGLIRQGQGDQPWTFGNQTGISRELALKLELSGLIKTGGRNSMIARIFFLDAGNVKTVKSGALNAVVADLFGATGTDGE